MNRRSFIATALATIASIGIAKLSTRFVVAGSVQLHDAALVELLAGDTVISSARANGAHFVALSGKAYSNQVRLRITPDVGYIDKSVSFSRIA